jgi:hypothetical protein
VPLRLVVLAALALFAGSGLSGCGGGGGDDNGAGALALLGTTTTQQSAVASRNAQMANVAMSRRLLSGTFKPPAGFTLETVNPSVPLNRPADGAVEAVLTSPTGVEYVVMFGPTTVPCVGGGCTGASATVPIGSANPATSGAVFAPDIGRPAECGYDSDAHEIGCDSIANDEYISVHGQATGVSTLDAVAVLRAAIAYVQTVSAAK